MLKLAERSNRIMRPAKWNDPSRARALPGLRRQLSRTQTHSACTNPQTLKG